MTDLNQNITKKNIIFQDSYELIKKIGAGSFGDVYLSRDKETNIMMASKVEECKKNKRSKLQSEDKIYNILHSNGVCNIPKVHKFIKTKKFHIMNLELLGDSLDAIFTNCEKQFNIGTTIKLGIEMVEIMENLHNAGIIHRDIKPNNFMIGKNNRSHLYIMDFGLSKRFMKNEQHIKPANNRNMVGTARYVGLNVHLGFEPSRRDDMESIGYMLIYFVKGLLPWQGLKKDNKTSQIEKIKEVKMSVSLEKLCEGLPQCFREFISHVKSLGFYDKPNYNYLKKILIDASINNKISLNYEWDV
jgi:serine/threonine protein kinase